MPQKPSGNLNLIWRISFTSVSLVAWIALVWTLTGHSETGSAVLLGYSAERLVIAAASILPALVFSWVAWLAWANTRWLPALSATTDTLLRPSKRFWTTLVISAVLFFFSWIFFFLPVERGAEFLGSYSLYLPRLHPLLFLGIVLGAIGACLLVAIRYGFETKALAGEKKVLCLALFVFFGLLLVWVLLLATGLGLGFDATVWNAPGAPVLSSQVFLVLISTLLILITIFALRQKFPRLFAFRNLDLGLATLVWLLAAALWLHQPAQPTYYSSAPRPPNFESYPVSDAFNHDVVANNVLIGEGFHFGGLVAIRRPLYILFLAGLEALLGPHYDLVVSAQVIVLALFPALLYLLGAKLHSRFSGLFLSGVIAFRETNSIALGHVINTSHAKLLMADLPTALGMAALGLAAVIWLRGSPRNTLAGLLTGGVLGAFILLRSQTLTLIPFFILLALLVWGWRVFWKQALLFLVGIVLVASPWIIRNRIGMGQWAIEDSIVSGFLANRYRFDPGTFGLPFLPGETEGEYYARQMASVKTFAFQNPAYVASFVADNFVRNELLNFLATPISLQLRDLESQVRELPYWPSWDGHLAPESMLPMLANLFLVGLGLAVAWRQARWVGMVPLFINIGFTLNLALARVSGWRYNLPVDWTVLLYFALGVGQIAVWGLLLLHKNLIANGLLANLAPTQSGRTPKKASTLPSKTQWLVGLIVLLLLGNSFLIIESLSIPRYQKLTSQVASLVLNSALSSSEVQKTRLEDWLAQGHLDLLNGRALYPTFYRSGERVANSEFALNKPLDFKRITFYLIGPEAASVNLRVDSQQLDIPTGSNVVVYRCGSNAGEAAAIVVHHQNEPDQLIISTDLAQACPGLGF